MKISIFNFPFAGGNKYCYQNSFPFSSGIDWIPIEYSGHGSRISEPLLNDLNQIAEDSFNQIKCKLTKPYALFGHSMGAMVAFLVAHKVAQAKLPPPLHLFLAGRGAPSATSSQPVMYNLRLPQFIAALKELGGVADEALEDKALMEFFEPILRSDFEAIETYTYQKFSPLDTQITVLLGTDEKVTFEEALAWQEESNQDIDVRQFYGKHFFIFDHGKEIVQLIELKLWSQFATLI